jgi:hypothetical protein
MKINFIDANNEKWDKILEDIPHDIYHLRKYVSLEAQRIDAIAEAIYLEDRGKIFFLPYLIRSCNDLFDRDSDSPELFDIVSPYGYPGPLLNCPLSTNGEFLKSAIDLAVESWRNRNICSAFLRMHPVLNEKWHEVISSGICQIAGQTVTVDLTLSVEEIWQATKSEHRNKINRCKKRGFTATIVSLQHRLDDFKLVYQETMDRVSATKTYYFDDPYYKSLAELGPYIHLCIVEQESQIAAAGIFTECCGIVQYHLGGTKSEFFSEAPSKLMFDHVRFWGKERNNKLLHLGGGLGGAQDNLYKFKAGFSKSSYPFTTMKIIVDVESYTQLLESRAKKIKSSIDILSSSSFFPAYRVA